ncbi:MAG: penicillin acylase family protein [Pirellulales bacterium]
MAKRIFKYAAITTAVLAVLLIGFGLWVYSRIAGSLPTLDGHIRAAGLAAEVVVERDALGIPTIRARNRNDLAFATGFVHAQDRFFQMDLLRRNSAGELAEIVGGAALDHDRKVRVHRFRDVAQRVFEQGSAADRALLEAYAQGVNAGLASLRAEPFEYWLLNVDPAPWQPQDSALVMFSMFLDLQDSQYRHENRRGLIHDVMGDAMLAFLCPRGTQWDAPVDGEAFAMPPTPGPDVFDTRNSKQVARHLLAPPGQMNEADTFHVGSNNWAVAGTQTADGRALVADDMHLSIRVPHVWYRASLVWPAEGAQPAAAGSGAGANSSAGASQRVTGVTLPGTPAMVVGSNGHVAWGFTNSEGDWADIVIVEVDPNDKDSYLTPAGPRKFDRHKETIKVKGAKDETLTVDSTIWGPIVDRDHQDRPRALRWVAHDPEGVNMNLIAMESASTLEDALRLANLSGSPAQNFVVADDRGRIAWTILGRIPRRVGFDGYLPSSWANGAHRWDGYLEPEQYPRIVEPPGGKLWTANARVVSGQMLEILGDGGYDLGARARQIRDNLLATEGATEADMLRIQLDDRAVFLTPWRELLLRILTPEALDKHPQRAALRAAVENWGERAGIDSVGYRTVRAFRRVLLEQVADVLVAPCKKYDPKFSIAGMDRTEGPLWRLVSERPQHMLDPRYPTWDALLLSAVDAVLDDAQNSGGSVATYAWGEYNITRIQHPLSQAVPALAGWLDMPGRALAGDSENMPRIQAPDKGASQRMAVSPGHEADGYMHMPCGQSGHPLSPHYRDAHQAWEEGRPTPFMPGPVVHRLVLEPAA